MAGAELVAENGAALEAVRGGLRGWALVKAMMDPGPTLGVACHLFVVLMFGYVVLAGNSSLERQRHEDAFQKSLAGQEAMSAGVEAFAAAVEAGDGSGAMEHVVADEAMVCQPRVEGYGEVPGRPRDVKVGEARLIDDERKFGGVAVEYRQGTDPGLVSAELPVVRVGGGYSVDLSGKPRDTRTWGTMTVGVEKVTTDLEPYGGHLDYDHGVLPASVLEEVGDALGSLAEECPESSLRGEARSAPLGAGAGWGVGSDDAAGVGVGVVVGFGFGQGADWRVGLMVGGL
jgi:hypothetical protein